MPPTPSPPPPPELTFLYTLHCRVAPALYTAAVPHGTRRVYPIKGGHFAGPRLEGTVLDFGADWGLVESTTGVFHADTRYALLTASGTHIYVRTSGPSQPPSSPAASDGGLHLRAVFEVGEGECWWLNHVVAIGRTQKVESFDDGSFTLRIDMWYMASANDQLTVAAAHSTPFREAEGSKT